MTWSEKTIFFLIYVLLGAIFSSVQANPISSRQVGLSNDVQVLTVNGTEVCQVGGKLYSQDQDLPTEDPCEYCTCQPPGFACEVIKCAYKPGCRSLQRAGLCCPEFICDCEYEGKIYENGDRIKTTSNPCEDCYCITGEVKCSIISCSPPPPSFSNCIEAPIEGKCCPTYECVESIESSTVVDEVSVQEESTTVKQIDSQEIQTELEDVEVVTTEIPINVESAEPQLQVTLENAEKTVVEESDTENSIFIQIFSLSTSTTDKSEDPITETTASPTTETVSEITESLIFSDEIISEEQPEDDLIKSTQIVEQEVVESSTEPIKDEYLLDASQTSTITEDVTVYSTEESTPVSETESEIKIESSTEEEISTIESADISITENEISDDPTEGSTLEESFADTTEKISEIESDEVTKLPTTEETAPSELVERPISEQSEVFSIYEDPALTDEEIYGSESAIQSTQISVQNEATTDTSITDEISSTETTDQETTDDSVLLTTVRSDLYEESKDALEISTPIDISNEPTTISSDSTENPSTSNADKLTTEAQEIILDNSEDEYWTSLLNKEIIKENYASVDNKATKDQPLSAPANKIVKSENKHEDKIHFDDDLLASESEIVIDEQPFVETIYRTEEIATTEAINLITTEEPSHYGAVTEKQVQEDITTDISNVEMTTEYKLFKSDIIELNENDAVENIETTMITNEETTTESELANTSDNNENIENEPENFTTISSEERKRDDDYWSNMMMGKNNPIEVMKEIAKISESDSPNNNDSESAIEDIVTEKIVIPEDSTDYLRSDIENSDDSTLLFNENEEATKSNTEISEFAELELTTEYNEPSEEATSQVNEIESNAITESEDQAITESEDQATTESKDQVTTEIEDQVTTESKDQVTTESSVEGSFRDDTQEFNEIILSDLEASTPLSEELTTEKYADDLFITEESSFDKERETTTLEADIMEEKVTEKSEITTTIVDEVEQSVTTEDNIILDDGTESEIVEEEKVTKEETKIEKVSEEIRINVTEPVKSEDKKDNETDSSLSEFKRKELTKESNIHKIDTILSNGSVTKIETHPSENGSAEKNQRISHQIHHLARKYGLRPLTKRTFRDEIPKRKVFRRRKVFIKRRRM